MIKKLDLPCMCWPGCFREYPSYIHLLSLVAISWQGAFNGKTRYFFGKNNSPHGICLSTFCSEGADIREFISPSILSMTVGDNYDVR
jgi:hypothetical protein